ncbi:uncharacterized protein LOC133194338 [Saccostrea echinata]|uniref:uncharacterized protein LOC133194338 n=1 Tax=Saccostrea echinata TaxID=191078 RepID=UPI002A7EF805|nr:uncharacterized protein LOC133194338 [Saccostrea echinata]
MEILHHMKSENKPVDFFLSGGAGVGKTVVVKSIYQALNRHFNNQPGSNPDEPKVLLAAPTGKAAFLINGNTIHNLFQIPANQGFFYKPLKSDRLNTLRCKFQKLKMISIDEISMVGNRMFQYIHLRLQEITVSSKIFGGISVLAVGDLFQLKPVFDSWIFENLKEDYGPLATNLWTENFKVSQLNQKMRQSESEEFASVLNRIRECKYTEKDIAVLKERKLNKDETQQDYPLLVPHIFLQNKDVRSFNSRIFALSHQEKFTLQAKDYIIGDVDKDIKEKVKKSIPEDTSKTMGLEKTLNLCKNMRCEISVNIDVDDGLANGLANG